MHQTNAVASPVAHRVHARERVGSAGDTRLRCRRLANRRDAVVRGAEDSCFKFSLSFVGRSNTGGRKIEVSRFGLKCEVTISHCPLLVPKLRTATLSAGAHSQRPWRRCE
jgi:hypothetical protein